MQSHPSPALEAWRWAREDEEPADPRAVEAAWDLVTLHASAEANKLNHAMKILPSEVHRTLLPALVVAGSRRSEVGTFEVVDAEGRPWRPRDLAFIPGRMPLEADLRLECLVEVGRNVLDFRLWYRHRGYARIGEEADDLQEVSVEKQLALLISDEGRGPRAPDEARHRDIELQSEGYVVVRFERSDLWRDAIGHADEALRTLVETARFDCHTQVTEIERARQE